MKVEIFIPGDPRALKRHRYRCIGRGTGKCYVQEYDPSVPDKSDFYSKIAVVEPEVPISTAIDLTLIYQMPMPGSWSAKKKILMDGQPCPIRPDLRNLDGLIEDSLNAIFWQDDRFIWKRRSKKIYSSKPGIWFCMEWKE